LGAVFRSSINRSRWDPEGYAVQSRCNAIFATLQAASYLLPAREQPTMSTTIDNAESSFHAEPAETRMAPRLKLLSRPWSGHELTVPAGGLILGRQGQLAEQLGPDPAVSRKHARVYFSDQGQPVIEDLGSVNGTFVNGRRVSGARSLGDQDVIKIGSIEFRFAMPSTRPAMTAVHEGTRQISKDPSQLLSDGRRQLEQGQLDASSAAFLSASRISATAAEGHYGLGMVALARGDPATAEASFSAAVAADPANNNALFQLGFLWEKQGRRDDALSVYRRVLAAQPQHASARVRHEALSKRSQQPPIDGDRSSASHSVTDAPDNAIEQGQLGVLSYLMSDPTPLSRQAVSLIQQLKIDTRPRYLAYLGRHPLWLSVLILATVALLASGGPFGLLPLAAMLAIYGAMYMRVTNTRVRIRQGRLQIERGVFHKDLSNFDLWRVRAISLKRTLINRMTGDGTLILSIGPEGIADQRKVRKGKLTTVKVPGLAQGTALTELYQTLLNLVFLLRGNPVVKGIIQ
jgi:tetratricopeptide (TPR) repeat protein